MASMQNAQMEPYFGWRVSLLPKSCDKHIRILLMSMLAGGQAGLGRFGQVC